MVIVEWIAGHIGHPWNELADAAAKQAAHNPEMSATRLFGNVDPLLSHRQLEWFFLSRLDQNDRMQYPVIVDGVFSVTDHEETLNSSDVATLWKARFKTWVAEMVLAQTWFLFVWRQRMSILCLRVMKAQMGPPWH